MSNLLLFISRTAQQEIVFQAGQYGGIHAQNLKFQSKKISQAGQGNIAEFMPKFLISAKEIFKCRKNYTNF